MNVHSLIMENKIFTPTGKSSLKLKRKARPMVLTRMFNSRFHLFTRHLQLFRIRGKLFFNVLLLIFLFKGEGDQNWEMIRSQRGQAFHRNQLKMFRTENMIERPSQEPILCVKCVVESASTSGVKQPAYFHK